MEMRIGFKWPIIVFTVINSKDNYGPLKTNLCEIGILT